MGNENMSEMKLITSACFFLWENYKPIWLWFQKLFHGFKTKKNQENTFAELILETVFT